MESIYLFELKLYNGFLNRYKIHPVTIKTEYPEAVCASDFRDKVISFGKTFSSKNLQKWEIKSVLYVKKLGL